MDKGKALLKIFDDCQRTASAHKKAIKQAKRLFEILVIGKKEPSVERLVKFIALFATHLSQEVAYEEFWLNLLDHLLDNTNVKEKAIRFRACQLVSELLASMNEEIEINNKLWEKLKVKLLQRARDKVPVTRCHAAYALSRIQDPSVRDDPVIQEYIRLLATDSSKEVRRIVLTQIGVSKHTLPAILQRTRDVSEDVRREAYLLLAKKVDVRSLSISQRVQLLKEGLSDRCADVQKAATEMLSGWLSHCAGSHTKLLSILDSENNEEECKLAILKLCESGLLCELPTITLDSLSPEDALLWRVYCEYWKEIKVFESALPEASALCEIMKVYLSSTEKPPSVVVLKQLLLLCGLLDFGDELGRRNMSLLAREMLLHVADATLTSPILELLNRTHTGDKRGLELLLLEIISELRDALENMSEDNEMHEEIPEEKHEQIWLVCMEITKFLLDSTTKGFADGGIAGLHAAILTPGIQHPSPVVRNSAIGALVLFCLLDLTVAQNHLVLFMSVLENDILTIKLTALKGLFDLLVVFGTPLVNESALNVVDTMTEYLEGNDVQFKSIVVEGFARLLLVEIICYFVSDIIDSARIFSLLVLLYFDPVTESNINLRQCLSVFFSIFMSRNFNGHSSVVEQAFIPTLHSVLSEPTSSPLGKVGVPRIAQFMLSLFDISGGQRDAIVPVHSRIAISLAHEVLAAVEERKELCKVFKFLGVNAADQDAIKILAFLLENILAEPSLKRDKAAFKIATEFHDQILKFDQTPAKPLSPTKLAIIKEDMKRMSEIRAAVQPAAAAPTKRKQTLKPAARKRAAPRKEVVSESSEESSASSEDDTQASEPQPLPPRARVTRQAKVVAQSKMQQLSDSDEESSSDQSSESESESDSEQSSEASEEEQSDEEKVSTPAIVQTGASLAVVEQPSMRTPERSPDKMSDAREPAYVMNTEKRLKVQDNLREIDDLLDDMDISDHIEVKAQPVQQVQPEKAKKLGQDSNLRAKLVLKRPTQVTAQKENNHINVQQTQSRLSSVISKPISKPTKDAAKPAKTLSSSVKVPSNPAKVPSNPTKISSKPTIPTKISAKITSTTAKVSNSAPTSKPAPSTKTLSKMTKEPSKLTSDQKALMTKQNLTEIDDLLS